MLPGHFTDRHTGVNISQYLGRRELWVRAKNQATTPATFDRLVGAYGYAGTGIFLCCQEGKEALSGLGVSGNNVYAIVHPHLGYAGNSGQLTSDCLP